MLRLKVLSCRAARPQSDVIIIYRIVNSKTERGLRTDPQFHINPSYDKVFSILHDNELELVCVANEAVV